MFEQYANKESLSTSTGVICNMYLHGNMMKLAQQWRADLTQPLAPLEQLQERHHMRVDLMNI